MRSVTSSRALRALIVVELVLAAVVVVLVHYRPGTGGDLLRQRTPVYATATAQLYVDSTPSALGDANFDPSALASRGPAYAELARSTQVREAAARLASVPATSFAVTREQRTSTPGQRSADVGSLAPQATGVIVSTSSGSSFLAVRGQAPQAALAARLAAGVAQALSQRIALLADAARVPVRQRVTLRQLGPPAVQVVDDSPSIVNLVVSTIAFWVVLVVVTVAFALWRRRLRADREADQVSTLADGRS